MTELEKQLLHAFEVLERQHKEQHTEQCEQLDHASKQLDAAAPVVGKAIQQEQSLARQNRRGRGFGFNR